MFCTACDLSQCFDATLFCTGIGFLMVLISFDILWYYVTIMGWIQYYFVQSFNEELPWSTCGNWWNTQTCKGITPLNVTVFIRSLCLNDLRAKYCINFIVFSFIIRVHHYHYMIACTLK